MDAGRVQMLRHDRRVEPGATPRRPISTSPTRIGKVQTRLHSGLFFDETATLCHWHVPATHYLEAWSDARTVDGTVSIVQPLIQPLYTGKSAHEIVATMSEMPDRAGYDIVREFWMRSRRHVRRRRVRKAWRGWLHDGIDPGHGASAGR